MNQIFFGWIIRCKGSEEKEGRGERKKEKEHREDKKEKGDCRVCRDFRFSSFA